MPFCEGLALSDYQSAFSVLLYNQFFYEVKDLQGFQKQLQEQKAEFHFLISAGPVFPKERKCEIKTESIAMAEIHLRH